MTPAWRSSAWTCAARSSRRSGALQAPTLPICTYYQARIKLLHASMTNALEAKTPLKITLHRADPQSLYNLNAGAATAFQQVLVENPSAAAQASCGQVLLPVAPGHTAEQYLIY